MNDKNMKPRGLGRGLSALMADVTPELDGAGRQTARRPDVMIPIEQLEANANQPRRTFRDEDMADLVASVSQKGILQPLIVRMIEGGKYQIVAGERRWRAAQRAQLHEVPVLIRDYDDAEVLEVAIIENVQRADLNAVEEAAGYRSLMDTFGHTQERLAEALGKSRSHIANLLRLLNLPPDVLEMVRDGQLSAGHARTLVTAEDPSRLARQIVQQGLSVRAAEALAKKAAGSVAVPVKAKARPEKDADTAALEGDLSANLGMKVELHHKPGQESGHIVIRYGSLDELDTLCAKLGAS
ncbi:ParB/RepB/Spo0J family partition protein [Chachezhania sediminis]|uniref:ParB/RepB/Spo0J family partition protein n=1 Tax=Chachezhania sediminis TaxID=2599291 RepID=UPI00131E3707|nr:ParB/RepB/Spo0J family partition protein [Chachezhania sediminis]